MADALRQAEDRTTRVYVQFSCRDSQDLECEVERVWIQYPSFAAWETSEGQGYDDILPAFGCDLPQPELQLAFEALTLQVPPSYFDPVQRQWYGR